MPEEIPFKIEGRLPEDQLHQLFDFLERTSIGNSVRVDLGTSSPEAIASEKSLMYAEQVFDPHDKKLKLAVTLNGFKAFAADAGFSAPVAARAWNAARIGFKSDHEWHIEALKDIPRITYQELIAAGGLHSITELVGFEAVTFHQSLHGLIANKGHLRNCGPSTVAFYETFLASLYAEPPTAIN